MRAADDAEPHLTPAGYGEAELVEKRSRFIGQVWRVGSEAEAGERVDSVRARHRDARHNCWCYLLRGGARRASDDGEPQGAAGVPMLSVFSRCGVTDVCCVVTRYFGGVLLGAGGLARAYGKAARLALDAAGVARQEMYRLMRLRCPYKVAARLIAEAELLGGARENAAYGADVTLDVSIPANSADAYAARAAELSANTAEIILVGGVYAETQKYSDHSPCRSRQDHTGG
ncbi:MAG: YigZ family protein [Oscillospiraceae bacterium]|jgi:uncharacterized YigZ family protein|nr:YigZ family protein [Oscillospiraceae bacterium]